MDTLTTSSSAPDLADNSDTKLELLLEKLSDALLVICNVESTSQELIGMKSPVFTIILVIEFRSLFKLTIQLVDVVVSM